MRLYNSPPWIHSVTKWTRPNVSTTSNNLNEKIFAMNIQCGLNFSIDHWRQKSAQTSIYLNDEHIPEWPLHAKAYAKLEHPSGRDQPLLSQLYLQNRAEPLSLRKIGKIDGDTLKDATQPTEKREKCAQKRRRNAKKRKNTKSKWNWNDDSIIHSLLAWHIARWNSLRRARTNAKRNAMQMTVTLP